MYKDRIIKKGEEIKKELISIRRDIHKHPEPGLSEFRTSKLVADKLRSLGIQVQENVGVTGVVGLLKGRKPGKTVLLRADMDCLKMEEKNNVEYKSENPGYMHACGHDSHVTWLLGAAMILAEFREEICGNIKFVFQPAEENYGGAERMIQEGVLENPHVDVAIGAHVWPTIESGKIGVKKGPLMASIDDFRLTINGKGGHGASPHECIDPISIANQVYLGLQNIVSRKNNPVTPLVITVGKFIAGTAHNIIPDTAYMEGTIRTLSYDNRLKIPHLMEDMIKGITKANGGDYKFEYEKIYPPVINNDNMTEFLKKTGEIMLGCDKVIDIKEPVMIGEDFSCYQKKVPGVFFFVGTLNKEKGIKEKLHSSYFDIDEDILPTASSLFALTALRYLNN